MAEAADRARWNRTMAALAGLYNVNRDPKHSEPIDPMQFFPWEQSETRNAPPPTAVERAMFRQLFPGSKRGK